ncbi:MAG: AI-2E family transporter [Sideroxydans sp.]
MPLSRSDTPLWLLFAATLLGGLYLLAPILSPFVAAAILAYMFNPLVQRLCAWNIPRTLAVAGVMLLGLLLGVALLLVLVPLLQKEAALLMSRLPQWLDLARERLLPWLQQTWGIGLELDARAVQSLLAEHWQAAGGVATRLMPWLQSGSGALLTGLVNLLLIPLVMFYLLRDWNELLDRLEQAIPRHWHALVVAVVREVDRVLAEFLRGQLAVMALMSGFYVLALWLTGLEFALPIGLLAGLLVFVPYLGMVLGLLLATLAAVMQFGLGSGLLWVWGVFALGQILEGMVVTPWLVGERIGLHPLAVIFALMAFGQLFGFFGLLLALPLAAVLLVLLRHAQARYFSSSLYRCQP